MTEKGSHCLVTSPTEKDTRAAIDELLDNQIATIEEPNRVESSLVLRPTVSRPVWNKAPIWGLRPYIYYCQIVQSLLMWGAPSDERTGLSFIKAAGPRQRSHSRVLVPGTRDHILLSQIRNFPFCGLLRLAGLRWRYSTAPPYGRIEEPLENVHFILSVRGCMTATVREPRAGTQCLGVVTGPPCSWGM
jgi:hypothetical protein